MPTFAELSKRHTDAQNRKVVLLSLIEHIDKNFLPIAGQEPVLKLLNDDKVPIPVSAFESVVTDILNAELQQLEVELAQINATALETADEKSTKKPKEGK